MSRIFCWSNQPQEYNSFPLCNLGNGPARSMAALSNGCHTLYLCNLPAIVSVALYCTGHTLANPVFKIFLVYGQVKSFSKFGNCLGNSKVSTRDSIMNTMQYLRKTGFWYPNLKVLSLTIVELPYSIQSTMLNRQWILLVPQDHQFSGRIWNICHVNVNKIYIIYR